MPAPLRELPQDRVPLRAFDTVGLPALRALLRVLRRTLEEGGRNLLRGAAHAMEDTLRDTLGLPEARAVARDAGTRAADRLLADHLPHARQALMRRSSVRRTPAASASVAWPSISATPSCFFSWNRR